MVPRVQGSLRVVCVENILDTEFLVYWLQHFQYNGYSTSNVV